MRENFQPSLNYVLQSEGGFVNNPHDPGGATNHGITQKVYDAWRFHEGLAQRTVKDINSYEAAVIYSKQYWAPVLGDAMPGGLDYCMFDFAVNSGAARAIKYLQRVLGVADDGQIGLVTKHALTLRRDTTAMIDDLCNRRQAFLETLPTFANFGKGWTSRVKTVRERSKGLMK